MGSDLSILTQVVLGSPGMQCAGSGICRIIPYPAHSNCSCPKVITSIHLRKRNVLRFVFQKAGMPEAQVQKHFQRAWFKIEEAYALPEFILKQLSLSQAVIRPGHYAVRGSAEFILVDFAILDGTTCRDGTGSSLDGILLAT